MRFLGRPRIYPGPCKIRIFKAADCPSEDVAWLTHDPDRRWVKAARWAVVRPEAGPAWFKTNETDYAFDNSSGTMSVAEEDRRRYCRGDPELDDARLPQAAGWPGGLGEDLKRGMNRRWSEWLEQHWRVYKVREDSRFGLWLAGEVNCRKNVESAYIQKGLSRPLCAVHPGHVPQRRRQPVVEARP